MAVLPTMAPAAPEGHVNRAFLGCFRMHGVAAVQGLDSLAFADLRVPVRHGIPRFTPDRAYTDNFGLLRRRHSRLQLDSVNGTTDRRDTLLRRTGWPAEFFRDKLVLECGCGAGPDTEILLGLGARVLSVDLSGVDVARENLGQSPGVQLVQASIDALPLAERSFDVVFCHRVLQHTADPRATLEHILRFVKPGGAAFVHSYSSSLRQRLRWKYALLPLTNKLRPETLYRIIRAYSGPAFRLTNLTNRSRIGRRFNWVFVPFLNYRHAAKFRGMPDEAVLEYAIHDTFDALSPRYDTPLSAGVMRSIAAASLDRPFEVVDDRTVTLLRTVLA
jgi:SAM-dependent methyltransferase